MPGPLCHRLSFLFPDKMNMGPDWGQIPADSCWESGLGVGMGLTMKESARLCHCGSSPPKEKKEIMMLEHFNLSFSELDRLGPRHLS